MEQSSKINYVYSSRSIRRINECHADLQKIAFELIKEMDVVVLCGHRNKADQDAAYHDGKSKLKWPHSKHNSTPSRAIDLAPSPVDWSNTARFEDMCNRIARIAKKLKIEIRQGRDFSFRDMVHQELV